MSLVTVFLGVLVFALAMGNAMLFLFEDRGKRGSSGNEPEAVHEKLPSAQVISPAVNTAPLEQKIELAHRRLQVLENAVESSSSHGISPSMKRRIEKLDNFRSTIEAEMIGIKEILAELQNNHVTVKARTYKPKARQNEKSPSPDDLKKLIYNSR